MRSLLRIFCPAFLFLGVILGPTIALATELVLHFKDQAGRDVRLTKAELLLVAWGDTQRIDLGVKGNNLVLTLDESWLKTRWPDRFDDMEGVYLFIQAKGYASVRSEQFLWIGANDLGMGIPRVAVAGIEFPNGEYVRVAEGQRAELTVVLHKPRIRRLRVVDEKGVPASGIEVSSSMFWSASNHCGYLAGADLLGLHKADAYGFISLTDGDFEYAFEFKRGRFKLLEADGNPAFPWRLITRLTEDVTTIKIHRWKKRPLDMAVTRDSRPVAGRMLRAFMNGCACGACDGPIGETNKQGLLHVTEFFPEEWEYVFFVDENQKIICKDDPTKWPETGTINVDLSHCNFAE